MNRLAFAAVVALSPCLTFAAPAAQPTTEPTGAAAAAPATQPVISADLRARLDTIRQAYAELKTLNLSGTVALATDINGEADHHNVNFTGDFIAPLQFRHEAKGDLLAGSDGKKSYVFEPARQMYVLEDTPATSAAFLANPGHAGMAAALQDPALYLALSGAADVALLEDSTAATLGMPDTIDGQPMDVITVATKDDDSTFDFNAKTHLLRRMQIDQRRAITDQGVPNVKLALVTIDYTQSAINGDVDPKQFAWTPPEGAKDAAAAKPAMAGGGGSPNALVGKPAPAFTLTSADGKTVSLKDLKGKVVALDFWAIFCQPCKVELPEWDKLSKDKKGDKDFAFYTVNITDSAEDVKKFCQETGLSLPVLIDEDGKVAPLYNVEGIPETVLIGKDGNVKKVDIGFGGDEGIKAFRDAVDKELAAK